MGLRQGALTVSWILDANGNLYGTAGPEPPRAKPIRISRAVFRIDLRRFAAYRPPLSLVAIDTVAPLHNNRSTANHD
jgi:hypothetical protein